MIDSSLLGVLGGAVLTGLLLLAALSDLRARRIPNWVCGAIALSGLVVSVALRGAPAVGSWAAGLAVGFAIWIPFYLLGMLGAGDVKLFSAAAGWLGASGAVRAALLAAVVGGTLSIAFMLWTRTSRATLDRVGLWAMRARGGTLKPPAIPSGAASLPYGVAMAIGLAAAWWLPGLLRFGH